MWGLKVRGRLEPIALRTRQMVQVYAGRRMLPASEFTVAYGVEDACEWFADRGDCKAVWELVRKRHQTARIVRVTLSETGEPK